MAVGHEPSSGRSPEPVPAGRLITVFAAKGGCGKTTIATNLAVALHRFGRQGVCLVDLDLGFGDLTPTLGLEPVRHLYPIDRFDDQAYQSMVTSIEPGLDCVLAPALPGDAIRVPSVFIEGLLTALSVLYDAVVIDTPARFTNHVLTALDFSHEHVLVVTPERPALRNLRLTLDSMELLGYSRAARSVVFNRSDTTVGISAAEVERALRTPIAAHVPSSRDVPLSINRGTPLLRSNPNHPVSVAIRDFALRQLLPSIHHPAQQITPTVGRTPDHPIPT